MGAEYPYPPRMMKRERAAAYCDLSVPAFQREVSAGRLPLPVMLGGAEHWCRRRLDEHLERLSGGMTADWRARQPLYAP